MFASMKIGARLAFGFGLVLFITLLIGIVGVYNTAQFADQVVHLGANNTKGAGYLADAQSALWQLRWDVAQFIAVSDPEQRRKLADNGPVQERIVAENFTRFEETQRTADELAALKEVRASFGEYMSARPKWFQLYGEGKLEEAADWRAKTITAYGAATVKGFAKLIDLQRVTSEKAEQAAVERSKGPRNLFIGLVLVSLAVGALIAYAITRNLLGQLGGEPAYAADIANRIAVGDLTADVKLKANDDGSMLYAVKKMRDSLVELLAQVRQSADSVGSASQQIAAGNGELSSRTEEQASSLEETASSMEELTTTVKQNADSARQANQLAIGASDVAGRGGKVMGEVIQTMGGISEASRKIGDIISVIDGIAFQTNILALNAAVEAARAGEQGRGFAVVASEVRSLAQRSAAAAKEIKALIQNSVERVDGGTKLVEGAGQTMGEIVSSVKRVTDIVSEIAAASQEQLTGIEQVGNAVMQMDRVVQQNAAIVEESAAAAENMAAQAEQLVRAVARFQLDGEGARAFVRPAAAPAKPSGETPGVLHAGMTMPRIERHRAPAGRRVAIAKAEASAVAPNPRAVPRSRGNGQGDWKEF